LKKRELLAILQKLFHNIAVARKSLSTLSLFFISCCFISINHCREREVSWWKVKWTCDDFFLFNAFVTVNRQLHFA
jgi:hypothetical protein